MLNSHEQRIGGLMILKIPLTCRQISRCLTMELAWSRRLISRLHESGKIRITGTKKIKEGKPENIYSLTARGKVWAKEFMDA